MGGGRGGEPRGLEEKVTVGAGVLNPEKTFAGFGSGAWGVEEERQGGGKVAGSQERLEEGEEAAGVFCGFWIGAKLGGGCGGAWGEDEGRQGGGGRQLRGAGRGK